MSNAFRQALAAAQAEKAALLIKRGNIVDELAAVDAQLADTENLIRICEARAAGPTPAIEKKQPDRAPTLGDRGRDAGGGARRNGESPGQATVPATAPADHAGDTGVPAAPPQAPMRGRQLRSKLNDDRVWRALTRTLDEGRQPSIDKLSRESGTPRGSMIFVLRRLAEGKLIRHDGRGDYAVLVRPPDMPAPAEQPLVFSRAARIERTPPSAPKTNGKHPLAARDVAPGTSWKFPDHRNGIELEAAEDRPCAPNEPPGHARPAEGNGERPFWTFDRIESFKRMWFDGTSAGAIGQAFSIDAERVDQLRKQFGLKDRSVFTGASAS